MENEEARPNLAALLRSATAAGGEKPNLAALLRSAQATSVSTPPNFQESSELQTPPVDHEVYQREFANSNDASNQSHMSSTKLDEPFDDALQETYHTGDFVYDSARLHHSQTLHYQVDTPPAPTVQAVDPRTLTTWPAALRYVSNMLTQDPHIVVFIKKMIFNQHENEKSWWMGRQALIRQQAGRKDGQKQLNDVLRSVGGKTVTEADMEDPVLELQNYDKKVHAALKTMVHTMSAQLSEIGIPFFCINGSLVSETDDISHATGKISRQTLEELRKRMLEFLEQYCKE